MRNTHHFIWLLCIAVAFSIGLPAMAQASNEITKVNPDTAERGITGLTVTFTLDTDDPPPPPSDVLPDAVTIGDMIGTSVTHPSQNKVKAVFDIPAEETAGAKDCSVNFTTPQGPAIFFLADGFTVTAPADSPPDVVRQPTSKTVPAGRKVSFTVSAQGTEPISYQWQRNGVDIGGAVEPVHVIDAPSEGDAGEFRCIASNAFGDTVSETASLEVEEGAWPDYTVVDTTQTQCYDDAAPIPCPSPGQAFFGQDAQYTGYMTAYTISDDRLTVYDAVTNLTWTRDPDLDGDGDIDADDKRTYGEAQAYPATLNAQNFGGYDDWRVATIKELYSLMDFRGTDPMSDNISGLVPFIDTDYFDFGYGDLAAGERTIDSQWVTSSLYVSDANTMFGVNFADGRIKGYGLTNPQGGEKAFYVRLCRGNPGYGVNNFVDNGDGTVSDTATGLMWSQNDNGGIKNNGPRSGMIWEDALAWVEARNAESFLGHDDWRLPDAKEMQSLLDYSRAPDATGSAAIDPAFNTTQITNEDGQADYPWFWTGTTHLRENGAADAGVYICFGRSMGFMVDPQTQAGEWVDVHGAGAQRSDRKDGDFSGLTYEPDGYYFDQSPQGDAIRGYNYVRLVRTADVVPLSCSAEASPTAGEAPLPVDFSATATGGAGSYIYHWDFGDGADSNDQNPQHAYVAAGNFGWTLTVTSDGETCIQQGTVTVTEPPCVLACTAAADPGAGTVPLTVNFTGDATATDCQGQVAYTWDFGDGGGSVQQSPSHEYITAGTYTWTLTVTADGETCIRQGNVTVNALFCDLTCTAAANPSGGTAPLTVDFTGDAVATNCQGQISYTWDFGDSNGSAQEDPTHQYTGAGTFTWTLTVTVDGETCIQQGTITVDTPPCVLTCTASATPSAGTAPLTVDFEGDATATNCQGQVAFVWDFGDGNGSAQQNPTHEYANAGTYTWTLTVTVDGETCTQQGTITVNPAGGLPGDCDGNGTVTIGEVQRAINMFLGVSPPDCGVDANGDGTVSIGEVQRVINAFLG